MSTYNNLIPQPDDQLADSQEDLLGNFADLEDSVVHDHVSLLASATEKMKHELVKLKDQTANLPYATLSDEGAIYTKVVDSQDDLYYKHFNDGPEVKLTGGGSSGGNVLAFFYASFTQGFPGAYVIQYQSNIASLTPVLTPEGDDVTVAFTTALKSADYVVILQSGESGSFAASNTQRVLDGSLTTAQFKFNNNGADGIFCAVVG